MSHIRYCRAMVLSVGFGSLATGFAFGQEGPAPVDRAWEAIRREADAHRKEMAARFVRLKALEALGPVPVRAPVMIGMQAFPAVVIHGQRIALMEEIPLDPDGDDDEPGLRVRVYTAQAFDYFVFGDIGGADRTRLTYNSLLRQRLDGTARTRQLTHSQIEKLRLAGKGDIKRRFDEIDAKRKEFAVARLDPAQGTAFVRGLVQFRATQFSLFEEGSLFAKVLNQITESAEGSGSEKPLPGSQLALDKALERANVIVAATALRPLAQAGSSYPSIWCADATVTHSFKGDVARGTLRLNAIPIAQFESLPTVGIDREFLLFIERNEGDGIKLHRVIKMLPATKDEVRFVEDALGR